MLALQKKLIGKFLSSRKNIFRMLHTSSNLPIVLRVEDMNSLIEYTNKWNIPREQILHRTVWMNKDNVLGYISPVILENIRKYDKIFVFDDVKNTVIFTDEMLQLQVSERTKKLQLINIELRNQGIIKGWRNELFPVAPTFSDDPIVLIERGAAEYYGIKAYGVHLNGFVRHPHTREVSHIWVATRAANKSTYPNMLDHIVAGGLPYGVGVMENVLKECSEEASIPPAVAATARPVGALLNTYIDHNGNSKRDCIFCFDLELPEDFVPVPQDGEVAGFQLRPVAWVLQAVLRGGEAGYKPNCNLVLTDFFIR